MSKHWYVQKDMHGDAKFGIVQRGTEDIIYLAFYEEDANDLVALLDEAYKREGL